MIGWFAWQLLYSEAAFSVIALGWLLFILHVGGKIGEDEERPFIFQLVIAASLSYIPTVVTFSVYALIVNGTGIG